MTFADSPDCVEDRSNTLSFQIILMMGVTFVTVSALISFYINRVNRKNLLSKSLLPGFKRFKLNERLYSVSIFSRLVISMFSVLRVDCIHTEFLYHGRLFHDLLELRTLCRHY